MGQNIGQSLGQSLSLCLFFELHKCSLNCPFISGGSDVTVLQKDSLDKVCYTVTYTVTNVTRLNISDKEHVMGGH